MNTYIVKLNFLWDDGDDSLLVSLTVPNNVSSETVVSILEKAHSFLDFSDEDESRYATDGRNPETLLAFVCEQNKGWSWDPVEADMEIQFD